MAISVLDLQEYLFTKHHTEKHDPEKIRFFLAIQRLLSANQLTADKLTTLLGKANRDSLFFYERENQASVSCEAAQLVKRLYRENLQVPLQDEDLQVIVKGKPEQFIRKLSMYPYQNWLHHPTSADAIQRLEQELKYALKYNENLLSPFNFKNASLKEIFSKDEKNALTKENLIILYQKAPHYLSELLHQVYEEKNIQEKPIFISNLINFSKEINNQAFCKLLAHINAPIAAALVENNLIQFFELSREMQQAVAKHLRENKKESVLQLPPLQNNEMQLFVDIKYRTAAANDNQHEAHQDYNAFKDRLYTRLFADESKAKAFYAKHHINPAKKLIQSYLQELPGDYKWSFFDYLGSKIEEKGLTIELLNQHLNGADKAALFAKWSGPENSRAAKLMAELYKLATGLEFNESRVSKMVSEKEFKFNSQDIKQISINRKKFLEDTINGVLLNPVQAVSSPLERFIAKAINFFHNIADHFCQKKAAEQAKAEAIYQQYLMDKAVKSIQQKPATNEGNADDNISIQEMGAPEDISANLVFDPQGRVIVPVILGNEDYSAIVQAIDPQSQNGSKEDLEGLLGCTLTKETLCSIDIGGTENAALKALEKQFVKKIISVDSMPEQDSKQKKQPSADEDLDFDNIEAPKNVEKSPFEEFLKSPERSAIIPLQEEMQMHVLLCLRAIEKKYLEGIPKASNPSQLPVFLLSNKEKAELCSQISQLVLKRFIEEFNKAKKESEKDFVTVLNQGLDIARKDLAPDCRKMLMEKIKNSDCKKTLEVKGSEGVLEVVFNALKDSDFTKVTATGLDYLRSDASNQSIVRISATKETAHNKAIGKDKQALRVLARNQYDAQNGTIAPYANPTLEARVPSIAVKEVAHSVAVDDVAKKLKFSHEQLSKKRGGMCEPLVYHLHTSLHTKLYDNSFFEASNKQRASAARILKGSHVYNLEQLQQDKSSAFAYVQNVPVNQHTNQLNARAFDGATAEAALMTDIALLSTFSHHAVKAFPPALRSTVINSYENLHGLYCKFLPSAKKGDKYFKDSEPGQLAIGNLEKQKVVWQKAQIPVPANADFETIITQALFKMFANNHHQNKQFGMLTQALSIFVTPMSQGGCKSGNERYQAVAGRVELLKGISAKESQKLSKEEFALYTTLVLFVNGKQTVDALQKAMDTAYNQHNVYGSASIISIEDQGASFKTKATANTSKDKGGVVSEYNTNYIESNYLQRLRQEHTANLQSHKIKNIASELRSAFESFVQVPTSYIP